MQRFLKWTDAALLVLATLLFGGLLVCVTLQVVSRYLLQLPIIWTEELAVYLFIWSSLLAAAVLVGTGEHFSISSFVDLLPPRARRPIDVGVTMLCILFALVVIVEGTAWSWRMRSSLSTVLPIPRAIPYMVIPLTALYMLAHLVGRVVRMFAPQEEQG